MTEVNSEFCVWAVSRRSCAALNILFRAAITPLPVAALSFDAVNVTGFVIQGQPTIHDSVASFVKTLARLAGEHIRARKSSTLGRVSAKKASRKVRVHCHRYSFWLWFSLFRL
jgi:hypothetical protein